MNTRICKLCIVVIASVLLFSDVNGQDGPVQLPVSHVLFLSFKGFVAKEAFKASSGTGFFVTNTGHVLTCNHVIPESDESGEAFQSTKIIGYVGSRSGQAIEFRVLKRSQSLDLAILVPIDELTVSGVVNVAGIAVKENSPRPELASIGFASDNTDYEFPEPIFLKIVGEVVPADGATGPGVVQWICQASSRPGCSGSPIHNAAGEIVGIFMAGNARGLSRYLPIATASNFLLEVGSPLGRFSKTSSSQREFLAVSSSAPGAGIVVATDLVLSRDTVVGEAGRPLYLPNLIKTNGYRLEIYGSDIKCFENETSIQAGPRNLAQTPTRTTGVAGAAGRSGAENTGERGSDGANGGNGSDGLDGLTPSNVIVRCDSLRGRLSIYSRGTDGSPGGDGGPGGQGGSGGRGTPSRGGPSIKLPFGGTSIGNCEAGPGRGGNGGNGGMGGTGGRGGSGGSGASAEVLVRHSNKGVVAFESTPGAGATGGRSGVAGGGGAPGQEGVLNEPCRTAGRVGTPGAAGSSGNDGPKGANGNPGMLTITVGGQTNKYVQSAFVSND